MSVVLLGLLLYAVTRLVAMFQGALPEPETRIDIYSDRLTYRTNSYETTSRLAVGLKAVGEPPQTVGLHDCARMADLQIVVGLLRELDFTRYQIELPDDC